MGILDELDLDNKLNLTPLSTGMVIIVGLLVGAFIGTALGIILL